MKFKNKIITLCLSALLFFSSAVPSSASTIVAGGVISYELLMGLMGVGALFGLSLPKDDNEYWDYTRSLKKHLQVVDDNYLDKLDKSIKEWKINNNKKPDNEKEPLKLPYIPGLNELFDSVGEDVSREYKYVNNIINPVATDPLFIDSVYYKGDVTGRLDFTLPGGHVLVEYNSSNRDNYIYLNDQLVHSIYGRDPYLIGLLYKNDSIYLAYKRADYSDYSYTLQNMGRLPNLDVYDKPSINYNPTSPSVDNDELILPNLPSINIPNIESIPGYQEGLEPPFDVDTSFDESLDKDEDVGVNPSPNPGTGGNIDADSNPSIIQGIINLFVPSSNYWQDTFNEFFDNIGSAFPMIDISRFKDLCINGVPPKDIEVTIMGARGTIFNTKYLNSIVDWLQPIVSAFMAFLLMLYNYRKVYKLIRGFEPFDGPGNGSSTIEGNDISKGAMWSDGTGVTRHSIQKRYYGRDI